MADMQRYLKTLDSELAHVQARFWVVSAGSAFQNLPSNVKRHLLNIFAQHPLRQAPGKALEAPLWFSPVTLYCLTTCV